MTALKGSIENIIVNESGDGYVVGDTARFDNTGTNGGGLSVSVKSVEGKQVLSVETTVDTYENTVFVWRDSEHVAAYISTAPSLNGGRYHWI